MNNTENNQGKEKQNKKLKNKVDNRNIVILILLVIIVILLLKSCSGGCLSFNSIVKPQVEDAEYIEQETSPVARQEKGRTDIPVIQDFKVSKTSPYQSLYNPESNTGNSYLRYIFSDADTKEVIYESDLVEPAYKFSVPFGDMLDIGEHDVIVEVVIVDFETYVSHSSTKSEITITVSD